MARYLYTTLGYRVGCDRFKYLTQIHTRSDNLVVVGCFKAVTSGPAMGYSWCCASIMKSRKTNHFERATATNNHLLNCPRSLSVRTVTTLPSCSISQSPIQSFSPLHKDASPAHLPTRFLFSSPPSSLENPPRTFIQLLKESSKSMITLPEVGLLHSRAIKFGFDQTGQVGVSLLGLYVKQSRIDLAHELFDEIPERDTHAWTTLISGYSRIGRHAMGLSLFSQMLSEGTLPNHFTLASVLKCCASSSDLARGKGIHGWILKKEIVLDLVLQNSLIDFYSKCGAYQYLNRAFEIMADRDAVSWNIMIDAHLQIGDIHRSMELFRISSFRDVTSWNTVISGLMRNGFDVMALQLLCQMVEFGPAFNQFTFSMALVIASKLALLELGREIHSRMLKIGFEHDAFIKNSLIDMYCKCGKMEAASIIFNHFSECIEKSERSTAYYGGSKAKTISWSSMVAGYVQNGRTEEAFELFRRMLYEGVKVDQFTLTSIAAACSDTGILELGRQIYACIEKLGHVFDVFLASAVIDMYAKCGSLEDAHETFGIVQSRNVVLWTSIIGSCALHGQGRKAIQLFERMLQEKIKPNEISFVGVLSACSHGGLVREGYEYFKSMQEDHGLVPSIEHFTCMVDLLGRAGLLNEAKEFIIENNLSQYSVVWRVLLSACRVHKNLEMAMWASEQLVRFEPWDAVSYILLSNTYSTKTKWLEASKLRSLMQDRGVRKQPGLSWIQLKNKVHTFVAGDRSHPQVNEIYSYLDNLIGKLKEMGYSSRTELVLHDVEEEQREESLNFHSEKLAIAYGIISTSCGLPLRVMKNLRVCADCHEAIKYISQATGREIILRDAHRFHHFKHGKCSCGDYW